MKTRNVVREEIRSYMLDPSAKDVVLECLTELSNFIDGAITFLEFFYQ